MLHLSTKLTTPRFPLSGYADHRCFKAFVHDTGLLGALLDVPSRMIVQGNELFSQYYGAFIENFVAVELIKKGVDPLYYWQSMHAAEVDFVAVHEGEILPLEVKSGLSRRTKSLRMYADKYQPLRIYRTSPRNFTKDGDLINIPLYAVMLLPELGG